MMYRNSMNVFGVKSFFVISAACDKSGKTHSTIKKPLLWDVGAHYTVQEKDKHFHRRL